MNSSRSPSRTASRRSSRLGPQVLDHLVRLQHVGPDLAAPADVRCSPLMADKLVDPLLWRSRSASLTLRICMARSLFWCWLRSFWQDVTIPLGRWVIRTAESVTLTCWPPAPDDR